MSDQERINLSPLLKGTIELLVDALRLMREQQAFSSAVLYYLGTLPGFDPARFAEIWRQEQQAMAEETQSPQDAAEALLDLLKDFEGPPQ